MKLLLDTHALIWAIVEPELLSNRVSTALLDESNEVLVSIASIWEISLKAQAGKLPIPATPDFLAGHIRLLGVSGYLPIELSHVYRASELAPIHKDPFDRILVAQALAENLVLVSKDRILAQYPVELLW